MDDQQKILHMVMEAIPCGLAMVNENGRITHWNRAAEKITGLDRMQVIGAACKQIFNCPNPSLSCPPAAPGPPTTAPLCMDIVLTNALGNIHLRKTSVYCHDESGRVIGAIESFVDLTGEHQAQAALHEARELAESARHAKRHFMANMSHEIRTPLNGILGMLSLVLADEEITATQRDLLINIRQAAELLMNLIDDILDFSTIDKGHVDIESTGFSLRGTIASVIAHQFQQSGNQMVSIHTHVQDDVPDNLLGDSGRLYQILKHLVGNAIKFTPTGDINVQVARAPCSPPLWRSDSRALALQFAISDTGVGIPKENLAHIFDDLSQVDDSSTRTFGGLGIGLNIVHRLIGMLDGRIWMESKPGEGTCVHFTLPFQSIHDTRTVADQRIPVAATGATETVGKGAVLPEIMESLNATPFSWDEVLNRLQMLIDAAPPSAEHCITRLKARAKAEGRDELAAQLFRLQLALRRRDVRHTRDHLDKLKRMVFPAGISLCEKNFEGGINENTGSGR